MARTPSHRRAPSALVHLVVALLLTLSFALPPAGAGGLGQAGPTICTTGDAAQPDRDPAHAPLHAAACKLCPACVLAAPPLPPASGILRTVGLDLGPAPLAWTLPALPRPDHPGAPPTGPPDA